MGYIVAKYVKVGTNQERQVGNQAAGEIQRADIDICRHHRV